MLTMEGHNVRKVIETSLWTNIVKALSPNDIENWTSWEGAYGQRKSSANVCSLQRQKDIWS